MKAVNRLWQGLPGIGDNTGLPEARSLRKGAHGGHWNPSMLQIIAVDTEDGWSQFKALLLEYAERDHANAGQSSIWADMAGLPGRYAGPAGGAVLARWQGQLAACGAFAPTGVAGLAEIKRLYVRESARGQGIARELTRALVQQCAGAGYHRAGISTWSHNERALALYQQMGFAPIAPFKDHPIPHLVYLGLALHDAAGAPH